MAGAPDPMRWKKHWGQYSGDYSNSKEIETYDNMMAEYAGIYGIPILYYTLNIDDYKENLDVISGESSTPKWDRVFQLTAIAEEWAKEMQKFSAFGLENSDELTLFVHKSTYDRLIGWRSNLAPARSPNLTPRPTTRGAYGPSPKDLLFTPNNGLTYEVITGGVHFLESNAQMFGHKFWYKLTLKSAEVSAPNIGNGESYGPVPKNISLQEYATLRGLPENYYSSNPQFIVPTPECADLSAPFTDPSLNPSISAAPYDNCGRINYTTTGGKEGPINLQEFNSTVQNDYLLEDGRVASKYHIEGSPKSFSAKGDNAEVQATADQVVDPQSDLIVKKDLPSGRVGILNEQGIPVYADDGSMIPASSEDYRNFIGYNKYGPTGRVIRHNRELWESW